jgi:putative ABC transport system ATP-binding protein
MKISISNLSKHYKNGEDKLVILDDLNLSIKSGQITAIIGQSGSGKTTLLSLLAGLDSPDSGNICFDETNISKLTEDEITFFRSQNLSIVFQQFHLMPFLTALENVALPLEILKHKNATSLAQEALNKVGLSHRLHHLPSELSGGESQRVALARAFVTKPKVLLADEPSGNLDQKTGEEVMNLLFKLVSETKATLILVTHNLELASKCETRFRLEKGKLIEC